MNKLKLMVVGDLHGDTRAAIAVVKKAKDNGVQHIMQVGDFGFWPHFSDGIEFLDALNEELRANHIMLYWLDGNHENFDALEAAVKYCAHDDFGRVWIRSHIRYCPRACTWWWDGKRFMTVGGAVSVDKDARLWQEERYNQSRRLWWPQEQLTEEELQVAIKRANGSRTGKPVDYLFTHDCPPNAPFRGRFKHDLDSQMHREKMERLAKAVKPKLWFHGHMHTKYDGYSFPAYDSHTTVYGLECNPEAMGSYGVGDWWGILDTSLDSFYYKSDLGAMTSSYRFDDEVDDNF